MANNKPIDKNYLVKQLKNYETEIIEKNYAKKTDLHSHTNKTVLDGITEENVTAWDKAQENIIESVKVNNEEITPDESKAVNIDLTNYAEHDEIVGENLIPYPYAQPERTTNGITFTFADDGSVIANGTATENADFSVCVRTNFGTDAALMLKPGIYAITGCPEGGSDSTYRIQVQFGDKTELKYSLKADYGKGFVFEVTEEYAQYACQIQCHVQKGYTVTDLVFKPMLVLGSVLKEYQPYNLSREALRTDIADVTELASRVDNQFATASGNFITVNDSVDGNIVELGIKGNSFQKSYIGKNILNNTLGTATQNGITCTKNGDGTYTLNGTATSEAVFGFIAGEKRKTLYKSVVGKTLKFLDGGFGTSNIGRFLLNIKGDDGNWWPKGEQFNGSVFTVLDGYSEIYVDLRIKKGSTLQNVLLKPMLTTDLDATNDDFEPYVGCTPSPNPSYPQAINSVGDDGSLVVKSCGKNLIPYPYYNGSDTRVGVTATVNLDSSITLKGTATSNYFFVLLHRNANGKGFAKKLRGKTVTISGGTSRPVLSFAVYDENGNNITPPNNEMVYDYGGGVTVTIPDNACDMYSYYYFSSGNTVDVTLRPQLEVSDVVTVYEPYKSSTTTIPLSEPLRAIGDIKDEITYQDGKWGVLRRIKRINANDLTWHAYSDYVFGDGFTSDILPKSGTKAYCNIAKINYPMTNDWAEFCFTGITSVSNCHLNVRDTTTFPTITEWNTYIASNDVYFDYPLATPTFTPFADQTLPYLSTYDGVTNISNDDALFAEMTVKYPTTDASGVGSRNESRIAELAKDTDDKFDDVNESLSVIGKCKNLLNATFQTTTHNGITYTSNGDGTYSVKGSLTGNSSSYTNSILVNVQKGKTYKVLGSKSTNISVVAVYKKDNTIPIASSKGIDTFIADEDQVNLCLYVPADSEGIIDEILKPMLTTDLNATYDDFVPYTGEGETLTHDVAELKNDFGGLSFSASGTTLSITDGTHTWTIAANS